MTAPPDDRETWNTARNVVDRWRSRTGQELGDLVDDVADALRVAREEGRRQGAREMREAAGYLHEQIDPASDDERQNGDPGSGAMGAVIEYRDKIRALPLPGDPVSRTGQAAPAQGEPT